MKQKDKELLLRDLSARLPYGVMCNIGLPLPLQLQRIFVDKVDGILLDFYENGKDYQVYLSEVKPYLRPMSSMTEEERKEYEATCSDWYETLETYDWLNAHQFDYRGLIPMNLALETPKGMYNLNGK